MADQVAILRPDTITILESWEVSTASAGTETVLQAVSDNNPNTWAFTLANPSRINMTTANTTLPATAQIKAVQAMFIMDASSTGYAEVILLLVWVPTGDVIGQSSNLRLNPAPFWQTIGAPAVFTRPDGAPITQSDIDDNFWIQVQGFAYAGGAAQLREAWLQVTYNVAPTATASSPADASTITTSARPTVAWTYADADGDPQERYRVKVFSGTSAVTDPETEAARLVWDSGEVVSGSTSAKIGTSLANGGYRWYVKVADAGSGGRYSAWVSRTFTISVTPPVTPTLTSLTPIGPWLQIVVTPGVGSPAADFFAFQRSYDGGTTWEDFRSSQTLPAAGSSVVSHIDIDTRRKVSTKIRAFAYRTVGGDPSPASAASNILTVTIPSDGFSYLKSSTSIAVLMAFKMPIDGPGWTSESEEDQAVFDPAGSSGYVVIAGSVRGERGTLTVALPDDNSWRTFEIVRKRQETVLLQTCYGGDSTGIEDFAGMEQYWIRLGPVRSVTRYATQDRTKQARRVTIGFRAVRTPV